MKINFLLAVFLVFIADRVFASSPPDIDSLEHLVRESHPTLPDTCQLKITPYLVEGLWDSLHIHIFSIENRNGDGTYSGLMVYLLYKDSLRAFIDYFGSMGPTSGVTWRNGFYYTFSCGSGIHYSIMERLFVDHDTVVIQRIGGATFEDLFISKTSDGFLTVYIDSFPSAACRLPVFNEYCGSGVKLGYIHKTDTSMYYLDTLGNRFGREFPDKAFAEISNVKRQWNNDPAGGRALLQRRVVNAVRFSPNGRVVGGKMAQGMYIDKLPHGHVISKGPVVRFFH